MGMGMQDGWGGNVCRECLNTAHCESANISFPKGRKLCCCPQYGLLAPYPSSRPCSWGRAVEINGWKFTSCQLQNDRADANIWGDFGLRHWAAVESLVGPFTGQGKEAEGESQPAEMGQLLLPPAWWDNIQPWVSFICLSQLRNTMLYYLFFLTLILLFIYSSNNKLAALFNRLLSRFSL